LIANARMYSISPESAARWRTLLAAVIEHAGLHIEIIEHQEPAPINDLWRRPDQAAVFMCGLPFSRAEPQRACPDKMLSWRARPRCCDGEIHDGPVD